MLLLLLYVLVPKGKKKEVMYPNRCIYDKRICSLDLSKEAAQMHYEKYKPLVALCSTQGCRPLHHFLRQPVCVPNSNT